MPWGTPRMGFYGTLFQWDTIMANENIILPLIIHLVVVQWSYDLHRHHPHLTEFEPYFKVAIRFATAHTINQKSQKRRRFLLDILSQQCFIFEGPIDWRLTEIHTSMPGMTSRTTLQSNRPKGRIILCHDQCLWYCVVASLLGAQITASWRCEFSSQSQGT